MNDPIACVSGNGRPSGYEPCEDAVSRQAAIDIVAPYDEGREMRDALEDLPSAQPYTEAEIQKMQDLYQAEIDEAFELGREDARSDIIHCGECIHAMKDELFGGMWCKGKAVTNYHYCGYAERRTDEQTVSE